VERVSQPKAVQRRVPAQERSRVRVQRILDEAAALVVDRGVEALSTREIAQAAEVPVASLYQYFADKEDVLLALAERDMAEMDEQVAADVGALEELTVADFVRTVMTAFVAVYHRRPAFVEIYLRGRTNIAVNRFGRDHNVRIAEVLRAYALDRGLADESLTPAVAMLAVEIGDRVFQLAFEHDPAGDQELIEEGITLMTAYLERYAA
jgi:AcrR family transcriptional regulator